MSLDRRVAALLAMTTPSHAVRQVHLGAARFTIAFASTPVTAP
jgi:hypothetical protein